jgi:hypothetical protein
MTSLRDTLLDEISTLSEQLEQLYGDRSELDRRIELAQKKLDSIKVLLALDDQAADLPDPSNDTKRDSESAVDVSFSAALFAAIDDAIVRNGMANLDDAYQTLPADVRERFEAGGSRNSTHFRARRLVRRNNRYTIARGSDAITLSDGVRTLPPPIRPVPKNPVVISHWTKDTKGVRLHWSDSDKSDSSSFDQMSTWILGRGGVPYVRVGDLLNPVALYREGPDGATTMSSYDDNGWNDVLLRLFHPEEDKADAKN